MKIKYFSVLYIIVSLIPLGSGLLVGQNKTFEDMTVGKCYACLTGQHQDTNFSIAPEYRGFKRWLQHFKTLTHILLTCSGSYF